MSTFVFARPNAQFGETKMPPRLVRSKTLPIDLVNDEAELRGGSHHRTVWALPGTNIETSAVIRVKTHPRWAGA